ncbi:hypothetical protein E4H04_12075 [Candidatus Bathyarchaeota archaeon]|nr:MAG: hypothetical protein E4H04_12075 [Candidatus Bathyarchaeota archaeon]
MEFIDENGKISLIQLSKYLNIEPVEVEQLLDELTAKVPNEVNVFDDSGKLIKSITLGSDEKEIKVSGVTTIKFKINKSTGLLVKSTNEEGIAYFSNKNSI